MKLNLASGTDIRPAPWVNLDVVKRWPLAARECDVLWDARTQSIPFPDGSADEAYAGYLFLHLAPHHHDRVLADIRRVLQPGGRLVVGEVEMDAVMRRWLESPNDARAAELIWGEQGELPNANEEQRRLAEFDKHCHGYSEKTLRAFLNRGGFPNARRVKVHGDAVWYELTLEAFR
jgi:ubiquinone/menaquinone biosynthesis C-methylase UbiE